MITELQTAVKSLISPIVTSYANQYPAEKEEVDTGKIYPYAVFSFPNASTNNEFSDNFILQVDIWDDKGGDATEIETVTDAVFHALNKQKILTDNLFIQIYRDTIWRLKLPDPDVNIQRRQLKFICKIYNKEQ